MRTSLIRSYIQNKMKFYWQFRIRVFIRCCSTLNDINRDTSLPFRLLESVNLNRNAQSIGVSYCRHLMTKPGIRDRKEGSMPQQSNPWDNVPCKFSNFKRQ